MSEFDRQLPNGWRLVSPPDDSPPEHSLPDCTRSGGTQPDCTRSDGTQPDGPRSDGTQPDGPRPDGTRSDDTQSGCTRSDDTLPESSPSLSPPDLPSCEPRWKRELDQITGNSPVKTRKIPLKILVALLMHAERFNRTWLKDFADDAVTIDSDLHDVLLAYGKMQAGQPGHRKAA